MLEKLIKIDVPEDVVTLIQRLQYDYNSKKDVVATLIATESDITIFNGEVFKLYQKETSEAGAALEIAKAEFEKEWVPKEYREAGCKWNLDFTTNTLVVELVD